jgi:D-alanyl-lipoteichoic acid acyltransferase DltB (MBOAT superfamily)
MFVVNEVALKVVDSFRRDRSLTFHEYLWFLVPFPSLAVVYPNHKRRLAKPDNPWPQLIRLILGVAGVTAGFALTSAARHASLLQSHFVLDHCCKIVLFLVTIESLSRVLFALGRLAGFATTPVIENSFMARSPAEFWRRYNRRVHDWMFLNIFLPAGGRSAPTRGVIAVFVFSAALHEAAFAIATSRVEGLQASFFLLQIPGVLASGTLERFSRRGVVGRVVAHAFTIIYMGATSALFFTSLSRVFPFIYAGGPPR